MGRVGLCSGVLVCLVAFLAFLSGGFAVFFKQRMLDSTQGPQATVYGAPRPRGPIPRLGRAGPPTHLLFRQPATVFLFWDCTGSQAKEGFSPWRLDDDLSHAASSCLVLLRHRHHVHRLNPSDLGGRCQVMAPRTPIHVRALKGAGAHLEVASVAPSPPP